MITALRLTVIVVFVLLLAFNGLLTRVVGGLFDLLLVVGIAMNVYRLIIDRYRKP